MDQSPEVAAVREPKPRWIAGAALLALAAGSTAAIMGVDSETLPLGVDARWLLAFSVGGLLVILALLFVPRTWSGRWAALLALAAPTAVFASMVKRFEFDGAMRPNRVVFRWEAEPPPLAKATGTNVAAPQLAVDPRDSFLEYRGPARAGFSVGPALATDWSKSPPRELWRRRCGGGYGGFAVVGEALFSLEQREANEAVVCYRRDTGAEAWVHEYPARFEESAGGPGPRATPTFHEGRVYSFGALGDLACLEAASGKLVWSKNPVKELHASN